MFRYELDIYMDTRNSENYLPHVKGRYERYEIRDEQLLNKFSGHTGGKFRTIEETGSVRLSSCIDNFLCSRQIKACDYIDKNESN